MLYSDMMLGLVELAGVQPIMLVSSVQGKTS